MIINFIAYLLVNNVLRITYFIYRKINISLIADDSFAIV